MFMSERDLILFVLLQILLNELRQEQKISAEKLRLAVICLAVH